MAKRKPYKQAPLLSDFGYTAPQMKHRAVRMEAVARRKRATPVTPPQKLATTRFSMKDLADQRCELCLGYPYCRRPGTCMYHP